MFKSMHKTFRVFFFVTTVNFSQHIFDRLVLLFPQFKALAQLDLSSIWKAIWTLNKHCSWGILGNKAPFPPVATRAHMPCAASAALTSRRKRMKNHARRYIQSKRKKSFLLFTSWKPLSHAAY